MSVSEVPSPHASAARQVQCDLDTQDVLWSRGFTRRRFIQGLGAVGVAALGSQLATSRMAFADAAAAPSTNTLVFINLKGGVDGLRMLVPASAQLGLTDLVAARPTLVPGSDQLLALTGANGWAVHNSLAPLMPFWKSGELAFVPAVTSPGGTRSHFYSQQRLQTGPDPSTSTGWIDRMLATTVPGTTMRAVSLGSSTAPLSFSGSGAEVSIVDLASFTMPARWGLNDQMRIAAEGMFRGFEGTVPMSGIDCSQALLKVSQLTPDQRTPKNGASYTGNFGNALRDTATLLRAEVGLQVCSIDVGGWDTHTMEHHDFDPLLTDLGNQLASFMADLGADRRKRVTVIVTTEFGRRVAQNMNYGSDHGMGSVAMVLGGGLRKSQVAGAWKGVAPTVLDQGDVPGLNDPFSIMAEAAINRLGSGNARQIFPGIAYAPLSLFAKT